MNNNFEQFKKYKYMKGIDFIKEFNSETEDKVMLSFFFLPLDEEDDYKKYSEELSLFVQNNNFDPSRKEIADLIVKYGIDTFLLVSINKVISNLGLNNYEEKETKKSSRKLQVDQKDIKSHVINEEKDENEEPVQPSPEQTTLFEPATQAVEKALPWKDDSEEENRSSGRLVVPIMILYLLVAVPLTTIAVLVLLVPTLIFLGLAAASGIAAFRIAMLAFNSFAVFADIIVVLGAALLLTALTIFFFWIFIWFIGGGIAGAINLAIQIGSKVCYRDGKKA